MSKTKYFLTTASDNGRNVSLACLVDEGNNVVYKEISDKYSPNKVCLDAILSFLDDNNYTDKELVFVTNNGYLNDFFNGDRYKNSLEYDLFLSCNYNERFKFEIEFRPKDSFLASLKDIAKTALTEHITGVGFSRAIYKPFNVITGEWTIGKFKGKQVIYTPTSYLKWVLSEIKMDEPRTSVVKDIIDGGKISLNSIGKIESEFNVFFEGGTSK